MIKKFFAIVAAIFFITSSAVSVEALIEDDINPQVNAYMATLPKAKCDYKSRQRPILIQGAMICEVGNLIKTLENPVVYNYMNYIFVAGTYRNYPVVVARTEIGIANAGVSTAFAIEHFNPIAVINQGTAGGYLPTLHSNDIVIADKSINHSAYREDYLPAGEFDLTKQTLRGTYAYDDKEPTEFTRFKEFTPDEKLLEIAKRTAALNRNWNVTVGTIGSAETWNNSIDHINFLHDTYGIVCEEMETNGAAQVCYTAKIPFIGIRVISNNIVTGEEYDVGTALGVQDFVLLVTDKLIREIKLGKF